MKLHHMLTQAISMASPAIVAWSGPVFIKHHRVGNQSSLSQKYWNHRHFSLIFRYLKYFITFHTQEMLLDCIRSSCSIWDSMGDSPGGFQRQAQHVLFISLNKTYVLPYQPVRLRHLIPFSCKTGKCCLYTFNKA